ncbi:FGGY family carbohydrate kinase [Trebonia sp.]|uniref:FGGY family carbohydrate kinase n=1 Tax=Trebonia sp. TaxID=2767075 RepID=UPI00260733F7|nr:FGGY family carbohydrate kinase [Trebonia sp.]
MSSSTVGPAFLGIDLGTSQLKALLTSPGAPGARGTPGGHVLGRGRAQYPVTVPAAGQAETGPADWWRAAAGAVREALAAAAAGGARAEVAGIAVAGQMHGVVLTDRAGVPLRPAILWLDRRAAAEAAAYRELPARLTRPLGNQPSPGMAGPILRWLTRHEPATVRDARWALQPKDWLRLRLTGAAATDPTDASGTLLFDLTRGGWATEVIAALSLPGEKLPDIREPTQLAGRLLPAAAAHLGLTPGIPVATGAADTAAALLAANPPADAALLTLGTGGQWAVPAAAFHPAPNTNVFRAVGGGLYQLAPAQNVGVTLDWVRALLDVSWQDLYDTAARPWRADTPLFLPYLTQERWDAPASGAWAGLTLAHRKDDLLRGALEGVAFLLRARLADLRAAGHEPRSVVIGGGGARHPAWRQLLADVLGLPLRPASTTWLSATGAAQVAAAAAGALLEGAAWDRSGEEPDVITPAAPDAASAGYGRFLNRIFVAAN